MIRAFLYWFRRLFGGTLNYTVSIVEDVPDIVKESTLYLVGGQSSYWLAVMKCPCGCGAPIQLPMSGAHGPKWQMSGPRTAPSLTPSVHRTSGCRSHFFLRKGSIVWCR